MILDEPIHTLRLILRTLVLADVGERYLEWLGDPAITRFLEVRHNQPRSIEDLNSFVQAMRDSDSDLLLGIFLKDSGRHVGNVKLGSIDRRYRRADIGFLIGERDAWGRGFATEAIIAASDLAFERLGMQKVTAGCYAGNAGSARALTKAGFVLEARLHAHWVIDGMQEDGLLFARFGGEATR